MNPASAALDLLQSDSKPKVGSSAKGGDFAATFERELRDRTRPSAPDEARKPGTGTAGEQTKVAAEADPTADSEREAESADAAGEADEAATDTADGGNELPLLADAGGLFVDWAALLGGPVPVPAAETAAVAGERLAAAATDTRQVLAGKEPAPAADAEADRPAPNREGGDDPKGELLFRALAGRAGSNAKPATVDAGHARTNADESTPRFSELLRTPTAVTGPAAPAVPAPGAPAPAPAVAVPMSPNTQTAWNQAFGERVVWMARGGIQEAQIQLNPRHLGPVEVRLSVHQDQVNVQFTAQHATTREAIEQALPRLRELFGDSGLQLGQADVGDYAARGQERAGQQGGGRRSGRGAASADGESAEGEIHETAITLADDGAVDYYA